MDNLERRTVLGLLGGTAAVALLPRTAVAAPAGFVMWRDPGCGCCLEWARRIEAAFGRKLTMIDAPDMAAVKRAQGVPVGLQSCHTALIQGVVIEGHVPPEDVKRLLAARKPAVKGLAVPGMPAGSPGMDVGHNQRQPYKVFAFGPGIRPFLFASHG
jgi:hypothetical protein